VTREVVAVTAGMWIEGQTREFKRRKAGVKERQAEASTAKQRLPRPGMTTLCMNKTLKTGKWMLGRTLVKSCRVAEKWIRRMTGVSDGKCTKCYLPKVSTW